MLLNLSPPTPLSYFASLVQSDEHFPLLEAAASLAQDEEPTLDVQHVLDDVERLLGRVHARLPEEADDLTRLAILTQVSQSSRNIASRNAFEPFALVRSPMMRKLLS